MHFINSNAEQVAVVWFIKAVKMTVKYMQKLLKMCHIISKELDIAVAHRHQDALFMAKLSFRLAACRMIKCSLLNAHE